MRRMKILLILLPTLISAQIRIEFEPPTENSEALTKLTGNDRAPATDIDMESFHLTKNKIGNNLARLGYKKANNIIVNHASTYGHKDLYVNLKPINLRVLSIRTLPVTFEKKEFYNDGIEPAIFPVDIVAKVKETLHNEWYEIKDLSVGHNIDFQLVPRKITRTFSWGQQDYFTRQCKLTPSSARDISLKPDQKATAVISADKTSLRMRVDYEATLDGDMYFEYVQSNIFGYSYSYNKTIDINDYFHLLDNQGVVKSYQIITATYYNEAKVIVRDSIDGNKLLNEPIECLLAV